MEAIPHLLPERLWVVPHFFQHLGLSVKFVLKFKLLQILVTSALKCLPKLFWILGISLITIRSPNLIPGPIQLDHSSPRLWWWRCRGNGHPLPQSRRAFCTWRCRNSWIIFDVEMMRLMCMRCGGVATPRFGCGSYTNPRMKMCFGFFEASHHWKDKMRWCELLCLWFCWVIF